MHVGLNSNGRLMFIRKHFNGSMRTLVGMYERARQCVMSHQTYSTCVALRVLLLLSVEERVELGENGHAADQNGFFGASSRRVPSLVGSVVMNE